ncbi:radical SAM protein [Natronobacterium gregoryi]|uniref:Fe-S oxidoreductase n=2 Tax=Natronobacterium gregoryi TaxID=44930 RepID=L0AEI1_NATGS|nr:radical SAM protein [Natronobacterium gregoryi]AFZ71839.1 putative Fe-S oxidoreductase [Natronobacterium gregoryi SP2]ELY72987.1 Radical SAM domain-containing protein [Natronobacterium gregoryi SP2]PLK19130.1 radical SAM protein [Natronobacterium gregoryi SP2]SFJ60218.1 Radical SAM superfamily enzyme with C-terminal helix-hairpin-helix motif [Natronobacterium gregoryi]
MTDPEQLSVTIVDGYVDEPAHFGVPPYVSTYPRYTAGALIDAGVPRERLTYHTIDGLRDDPDRWRDVDEADLMIYLGGMTVPGKYVGGTPAEPDEVRKLAWTASGTSLMGGPVKFGVGDENAGATETERQDLDFDFVAKGDVEAAVFDLVENGLEGFNNRMRDIDEVSRWAQDGAFIVEQHPNHPDYLIAELETSRGCAYRCSFCTEPLYGNPDFRPPPTVVGEVDALSDYGVKHFRLGRQADILAYGGDGEAPNPDALKQLYSGIRTVASDLETLHLDNMNPITIVEWPEKSREGIRIIAEHNTPGDTAAFGLESADPVVQEENNLNVTTEECFEAVRIVNEEAGWRPGETPGDGPSFGDDAPRRLPKLLPGINLLHGLKGEREETFDRNRQFLQRVSDEGYMLRRVNIRQVMSFSGTDMSDTGAEIARDHKKLFKRYKREIREEIDNPMLGRVAPPGTVLPDVHLEYHQDGKTFGRQLGTYPLLVGIPGERELERTVDVAVVDHGFRSVTGVPYPLDVNRASMDELTAIPGIGDRTAGDIVVNRPYDSVADASTVESETGIDLSRLATAETVELADDD